jgi:DNA-binding MarR family transcriptional regulator
MARHVSRAPDLDTKGKLVAAIASSIHRDMTMLRLLYVAQAPRVGQYAKEHGVSESNASLIFKEFEAREWISREGRRLRAVSLTPRGAEQLAKWIESVAKDIERAIKDPEAMYEDGVKGPGNIRRMLGKVLKGEPVTMIEAVKLEDSGHAKRISGRKIEITDGGVLFFRNGRRGPLPGKANRSTVVAMPSKE